MNRLQRELQRLYAPRTNANLDQGLEPNGRVDAQGRVRTMVRTMVLELARPADWAALAAVWGGVQTDLALSAPAIAVNGIDGYQLWFSLLEPVPVSPAGVFLDALRRRYLGDIAPVRVAMLPALQAAIDASSDTASDAASTEPPLQARPVPALQADSTRWSAFVAPDLAPMFADEPWLDVQPNPDGQAQLLASLKSIARADFELALQRLRPAAVATPTGLADDAAAQAAASLDPKRFLLDVMNNETVDLALRIEAAKALLPHFAAACGRPQERKGHGLP